MYINRVTLRDGYLVPSIEWWPSWADSPLTFVPLNLGLHGLEGNSEVHA